MCGRFANADQSPHAVAERLMEIDDRVRLALPTWSAVDRRSYDVRPTQIAPVYLSDGRAAGVAMATWGWTRAFAPGRPLINCRFETVATKPTFAEAFRSRRCVVPATAYYEWQRDAQDRPIRGGKHAFRARDGRPLLLAGLWEPDPAPRFIVLTRAMVLHQAIHDRTPVMLTPVAARDWVDPASMPDTVHAAATSQVDEDLVVHRVCDGPTKAVPAGPHLLEPVADLTTWMAP
jgi:putative SOS response-associated peptidase YedK